MLLQTKSVATKLLLFSCVTAVLVIVGIVAFIKINMIPKLTNKALENQTLALAQALKVSNNTPAQWDEAALAKNDSVDAFSNQGKAVATLFILKNGE